MSEITSLNINNHSYEFVDQYARNHIKTLFVDTLHATKNGTYETIENHYYDKVVVNVDYDEASDDLFVEMLPGLFVAKCNLGALRATDLGTLCAFSQTFSHDVSSTTNIQECIDADNNLLKEYDVARYFGFGQMMSEEDATRLSTLFENAETVTENDVTCMKVYSQVDSSQYILLPYDSTRKYYLTKTFNGKQMCVALNVTTGSFVRASITTKGLIRPIKKIIK